MSNYSQNQSALLQEDQTCPATGYQQVTVCVPVGVTPFVTVGATTTYCCGDPIVTTDITPCAGNVNGTCVFKITQQLCVAVPVEFGATATVGDPHVACGEASNEDICTDCGTTTTLAATSSNTCTSCKNK